MLYGAVVVITTGKVPYQKIDARAEAGEQEPNEMMTHSNDYLLYARVAQLYARLGRHPSTLMNLPTLRGQGNIHSLAAARDTAAVVEELTRGRQSRRRREKSNIDTVLLILQAASQS